MKFADIKKIDARHEKGGWVDSVRNLDGVSLRVRGEMNADYEKLWAELFGDLSDEDRKNPVIVKPLTKRLLQETVLLDWKGIDEPFTPKNVSELLDLSVFSAGVIFASRIVATRGRDKLEADAKNS